MPSPIDPYNTILNPYYLGNSGSYEPFSEYRVARYEQIKEEDDPKVFECTYCGNLYGKQSLSCPTCGGHRFVLKHMSDYIVRAIG
jgi:Zn finger protein HypA/HybF involved in hydrogenase expression